jgi:predicted Zn-dependent protease
MRIGSFVIIFSLVCGCLVRPPPRSWNFNELTSAYGETQRLQDSTGFGFRVSTKTIREVTLVYSLLRDTIKDIVAIEAELVMVESDDANAFVALRYNKPIICITVPMVILLGNDLNLYAALLGHEVAHLAWGHLQDRTKRTRLLDTIGIGIALSGTPASLIVPLGLTAINAAYSRDEEREADALMVELLIAAQFDPKAAVQLHELLREHSSEVSSFMSTHPSSDERMRNIRRLIEANNSKR